MRYLLLMIFCLFLFLQNTAFGQQTDKVRAGFFTYQFQQIDLDGFNRQAEDLGYPGLRNSINEFGYVFQERDNRWVTGFGLNAGFGRHADEGPGGSEARYRHYGARIETTYSLLASPDWILGPTINISLQHNRITLNEGTAGGLLTQAVEADYLRLTTWETPIQFGFSLQRTFGQDSANRLVLGLNAGYTLADGDEWRVDDAVPFSSPGIDLSGWFASVRIGFEINEAKE